MKINERVINSEGKKLLIIKSDTQLSALSVCLLPQKLNIEDGMYVVKGHNNAKSTNYSTNLVLQIDKPM